MSPALVKERQNRLRVEAFVCHMTDVAAPIAGLKHAFALDNHI
jgi:hypothetical protein